MAPLPKRKRTQTRKGKRWSHLQLRPTTLTTCPQCRNLKPSHRVCPICGFYAGREVITAAEEEQGPGTISMGPTS